MSARARFTIAEIKRAKRAADELGLDVAGLEIAPDGTIRILTDLGPAAHVARNPLDRLHGSQA